MKGKRKAILSNEINRRNKQHKSNEQIVIKMRHQIHSIDTHRERERDDHIIRFQLTGSNDEVFLDIQFFITHTHARFFTRFISTVHTKINPQLVSNFKRISSLCG